MTLGAARALPAWWMFLRTLQTSCRSASKPGGDRHGKGCKDSLGWTPVEGLPARSEVFDLEGDSPAMGGSGS